MLQGLRFFYVSKCTIVFSILFECAFKLLKERLLFEAQLFWLSMVLADHLRKAHILLGSKNFNK